MTHLRELSLSYNRINGSIPLALYELKQLEVLNLSYNQKLTGSLFPDSLTRAWNGWINLVTWDLASCGIIGTIGTHIGRLAYLQELYLQDNSLTGSIPEPMGSLWHLETIDLSKYFLCRTTERLG